MKPDPRSGFDYLPGRTLRERLADGLRNPINPWTILLLILGFVIFFYATSLPGFLEAQTRAKVARTLSDLHEINGALERYRTDVGAYPTNLSSLTTPTAYLEQLPGDIRSDLRTAPYRYHTNGTAFIVGSFGPDRDEATGGDLPWGDDEGMSALLQDQARLVPFAYDPTNGTKSTGDIWRVGGGSETE